MRLLGVAVADLLLGDDIRRLASHLQPLLREDVFAAAEGAEVDDFLREARSAVGGGSASLAPIRFVQEGKARDSLGRDRPIRLPACISSADLLLSRLPSALVMGATVARFTAEPIERLFVADHEGSVEVRKHSIAFGMVEEAKRTALARAIAPAASTGLLPAELGLLGDRRYPRGALVIWSLPEMPPDDVAWRDVARVLGIETWNRWDGPDQRLLVGVPVEAQRRSWEAEGLSLLLTGALGDAQHSRDVLDAFDLDDNLRHWLPWLMVMQCAYQVTEDAGLLRQELDRARFRRKALERLVAALHERQYQLARMKDAANDVGSGRSIGFPDLVRHDPRPSSAPATAESPDPGPPNPAAQAGAPIPTRETLREGVIASLARALKEGFGEVELSLQSARILAELNTGRSIRYWTQVVAVLTVVLCLLTLVLVYEALRPGQGPGAPLPGPTASPFVQWPSVDSVHGVSRAN